MENKEVLGHVAVLLTILIWGTTFISTNFYSGRNFGSAFSSGILCLIYYLSATFKGYVF